ncbi:hypothetical protein [Acidovorax sp. 69]|uniref:hypothetical protein n=1 Tax=Acidovorax sp. 69 TaxID=2035202 RepID=UPI001E2A3243|nr:hypothetical protein [Acidovorax sp. 69]
MTPSNPIDDPDMKAIREMLEALTNEELDTFLSLRISFKPECPRETPTRLRAQTEPGAGDSGTQAIDPSSASGKREAASPPTSPRQLPKPLVRKEAVRSTVRAESTAQLLLR